MRGEEFDFQDGTLRFWVLGIHGAVLVEGVDESGGIEIFDTGREAGVGFPFGTDGGIEAEAGLSDEVVPGEGVDNLDGGFEVEEGLDERLEFGRGARIDCVEDYDLLLID